MKQYACGRIYKITNTIDDKIYVGSTCQVLSKRMVEHRSKALNNSNSTIHTHMRNNNIINFNIVLIEQLENITKESLRAREDFWMNQLDTVKNGLNRQHSHGILCEHNKRRDRCKDCGGSQICEHNKNRLCCKTCNGNKYKCEICNKVLSDKSTLNRHNKSKHPVLVP